MTDSIEPTNNSLQSGTEKIDQTDSFMEQLAQLSGELCMSSVLSDVTFVVENEKLPAHRFILTARSKHFRSIFCEGLLVDEMSPNEIHLRDVTLTAFKSVLKYIYTGSMCLTEQEEQSILGTLTLANKYGLTELMVAISDHLIKILSLDNVFAILEVATLDMKALTSACYAYLDQHAEAVLQPEAFRSLSSDTVCSLLTRDTFYAPELQIFQAVNDWYRCNLDCEGADSVVSRVRFTRLTLEQLLGEVRSSGILSEAVLLDVITEKVASTQPPYRGTLLPEENVVGKKFGRPIIRGNNCTFDDQIGFSWHELNDPQGIVLELDKPYIINHIKMRLWDLSSRSYSYYVEVSENQKNWNRVIDHSYYYCRSWQFLYFPKQVVRYIRLVGTHNTENQQFHVIALEAMYSSEATPVKNGILVPSCNVATKDRSAKVTVKDENLFNEFEDYCQMLINGNVENYTWSVGYVSHTIDKGEILVQLGQPYWIDSMRLLLWDRDDRSYSFYIETSTDLKQWDMLVDKRDDLLKSWQQFSFEPRVVVFIRIVGTHNTDNEEFHCVHFECPAQEHKKKEDATGEEITNPSNEQTLLKRYFGTLKKYVEAMDH